MTNELSTPRINVDVDGEDVMVHFTWNCAHFERPVYMGRADGNAALGLAKEDARELHRKLSGALDKQDHADAGHPDTEEAMAEAEARSDERDWKNFRSGA